VKISTTKKGCNLKKKKNSGSRPHYNVHSTLGVDAGATGPRCRVDSIEGGGIEKGGKIVEG
jgi:hypothetical protein